MDRFVATWSFPKGKSKSNRRLVSQSEQFIPRHRDTGPSGEPKPKIPASHHLNRSLVHQGADISRTTSENRSPCSKTLSGDPKYEQRGLNQTEPFKQKFEEETEITARHAKNTVSELESHVVRLERENMMLKRGLRLCFAEMTLALSIVHSDSYYKEKLEELNYLICASVAKLCTTSTKKQVPWSHESLKAVLQKAEEGGANGKREWSDLVRRVSSNLHKDSKRLIAFTRYLIALILYTHVFSLFVFGLDSLQSATIKEVERHLLSSGMIFCLIPFTVDSESAQVISVRYAISRAVSFQLQQSERPESVQANLVDVLASILSQLYPRSSEPRQMAIEIVRMAVTTKREMTAEQGLFWCKWVENGTDPVAERVNVVDKSQKGKVALCTFPGFWKRALQDQGEKWIPIVLPRVELESVFR